MNEKEPTAQELAHAELERRLKEDLHTHLEGVTVTGFIPPKRPVARPTTHRFSLSNGEMAVVSGVGERARIDLVPNES
jgi:hypothetical protein